MTAPVRRKITDEQAAARELEIFTLRSCGPVLTVLDAVDQAFPALSYRVFLAALHRVRETLRPEGNA